MITREPVQSSIEHIPNGDEHLTDGQQQSLDRIDEWLQSEKRQDGTNRWWRFFDAGVRDEHGAVWTLYNDFHQQESPEGWRVFRCPPEGEDFQYVHVDRTIHTTIPGTARHADTHTVQFDIGGEGNHGIGMVRNDILNLIFRDEESPSIKFWSDKRSMTPVAVERMDRTESARPIIELGNLALEVERPAA